MVRLSKVEDYPSLTEQAYESLLEAIQSLELEPGQVLSVRSLSQRLGISRTPLKNALVLLEQAGLAESIPYEGVRVTRLTVKDLSEILELRMVLEGFAAEKAAESLSPEELKKALCLQSQLEDASAAGEYSRASDIGREFHQLLLSKVSNNRLIDYMNRLDIQYRRIQVYVAGKLQRGDRSDEEHRRILAALMEGDGKAAGKAMYDHLAAVRKDLIECIVSEVEEGTPPLHGASDATELP